jgi:glycosyltransferase involved in cell wall biosynthesis
MTEYDYPVTIWTSALGYGDGQDHATRGYLRALLAVDYEHVVTNPRGTLTMEPDLEDLRPVLAYPDKYRLGVGVRVREGDPRIGQRWAHITPGVATEAPGAPPGSVPFKWDGIIRAGDWDHDYYREHPDERVNKWNPVVDLMVIHQDPGALARARDAVARETEGDVPIVGITAWETTRIPGQIAQQLSDLDALVVPSHHTAIAIRNSGLDEDCPIEIVPHAITMPPLADTVECERSGRFVFYSIGTNIERKNLITLVAAYMAAFQGANDTGFVLKSNIPRSQKQGFLEKAAARAGIHGPIPKVAIYSDKWPTERIRQLHEQCDCWVDASRGEGFGLGQAEAIIAGNPVITTGWGAQCEVCMGYGDDDGDYTRFTDYALEPVDESMASFGVYRSDQDWADPDFDSLVAHMRTLYDRHLPRNRERAHLAAARYSLGSIGSSLADVFARVKEEF